MNSSGVIVGIDGGGTKSFLRAVDLNGNVVCEEFGGSTNLCSNENSIVRSNLEKLFSKLSVKTDGAIILSVCLGTAGISKHSAKDTLFEMLKAITGSSLIKVVGDMEIPLYANAYNENAVSLVSGTGSICFGRTINDTIARTGGWGHLFGDEGSGYWIGCQGLNAIMKSYDFRGRDTILNKIFLDVFEAELPTDIISSIYSCTFDKSLIASLAAHVNTAATMGDQVSLDILLEASNHLFQLIKGTVKQLAMEAEHFKILLSGSVATKSEIIYNELNKIVASTYPKAVMSIIEKDAAWGSISIAERIYKETI